MDQELDRRWRLVLLWQRGFLLVVFAIGVAGCVIAARSGDGLPAGQFAAVAVIALVGLIWNNGRHRRRKALEEGVARRFSRDTPKPSETHQAGSRDA